MRTTLLAASLAAATAACTASVDIYEDQGATSGASISTNEPYLSGCHGHASATIPSDGRYVMTTFGGGADDQPIYAFDHAVQRIKAARAAIDRAGGDVVFTGRCENFLHGRPDLDDTIRRLKAYADAGADCLYAPGIKTREQIVAVVNAVAPKSVNFLNSGAFGFTVNDLAGMGVRRISVGGTLARVAMHAFIKSAADIANNGKFDSFAGVMPNAELNAFFSANRPKP